MQRRQALKLAGAAALAGATGLPRIAAAAEKTMVVVVKIAGIPWFNLLERGVKQAGSRFGVDASMIGPANVDPAQQVKLVEDLIAKK
ncbi:MAG TPA: substrate-binding domain-containing protein, partial [Stellaceae bacterium]|nr:substrate-binding domain-containing protein [Stellaceae bacterium]